MSLNAFPDLIIRKERTILIVDITCPFDNRSKSFEDATKEKKTKYEVLRTELE